MPKNKFPVTLGALLLVWNICNAGAGPEDKKVRSVIMMIGDGMAISHVTLARWYGGGAPLAMDELTCGLLRTYGANTPITDSAPAATAFATGFKSFTGYVSVMPDKASMWGVNPALETDPDCRPLTTVLEASRLQGKATGIVATCEIPHATPAAFSSHHIHRSDYEAILEQQVHSGMDVVLAGGYAFLKPPFRKDGEDLEAILLGKGYEIIRTRQDLAGTQARKLWGFFADRDIAFDIDRGSSEPGIEEMTRKAIALLSSDPDGFFLLVEGSKIDWAAHANDPVGVATEVLAFDRAVRAAVEFARRDGNTAVIIAADHGTGGLSLGDRLGGTLAEFTTFDGFIGPLKKARLTAEGVEKTIISAGDLNDTAVSTAIRELYGIAIDSDEQLQIKNYLNRRHDGQYNLGSIIGPILSRQAHIGWTTRSHIGDDVALHVFHPRGYRLGGVVQNTAVAAYIAEILGLDLAAWNRTLYLPANKAFAEAGATVVETEEGKDNPVLVVRKGPMEIRLPANQNIAVVNGRTIELKSLVVHNGKGFFVPREAVDLVK